MGALVAKTKPMRISFNMFCCAWLFCWAGVLPRETLSGLFGRKASTGWFWRAGEAFINGLHTQEVNHCYDTFVCEESMREVLYGCDTAK